MIGLPSLRQSKLPRIGVILEVVDVLSFVQVTTAEASSIIEEHGSAIMEVMESAGMECLRQILVDKGLLD